MQFQIAAAFAVLLLSTAGASGSELVDSELSPGEVVERLKEVRQGWEEVEIEFAHFEYRPSFYGPKPRLMNRGRFLLMPGDCGELETFPADEQGQKQDGEPDDRLVWTPDEFQIHSNAHAETISRSQLRERGGRLWETVGQKESTDREPAKQEQTILQWFLSAILPKGEWHSPIIPESPKDYLPLVYAEDAEVLAERFDLSVMESDESIFLFARPTRLEDQRDCQQTAICIDRETFIPIAKRTVLPGRGDYHTWVVTSLRVNGEEVEAGFSRVD